MAPDSHIKNGNSDPADPAIAHALSNSGAFDQAAACWERILETNPESEDGWVGRAQALFDSCRFDEAETAIEEGLARVAESPALMATAATQAATTGNFDRARQFWKRLLSRDPENLPAVLGQAVALRQLGRLDAAAALLEVEMVRRPPSARLHEERGLVFMAYVDWENAIVQFTKCLKLRPNKPLVAWQLASAMRYAGREKEADDFLSEWFEGREDHPLRLNGRPPGRGLGQLGQDLWVLQRTGFRTGGYFVEFGACDGLFLSNTYLLERAYGWRGVCAEPNPLLFERLQGNRHCVTRSECVYSQSGLTLPFVAAGELGTLEAFADSDFLGADRRRSAPETCQVETISLNDLLEAERVPPAIDYISVDTEGSEYEILRAFDFNRWTVRLWTVEHNYTRQRLDIHELMSAHGYERIPKGWEDWYYLPDSEWQKRTGPSVKAKAYDFPGRFREVMADPNNALIPRVPDAGKVIDGTVVMHNGLKVEMGDHAYFGEFAEILTLNRGVHEPQQERVFMEVLKMLPPGAVMIELGAYWGFYSMWFQQQIPRGKTFLVEPDRNHLESGQRNFERNGMVGTFIQESVGPGGLTMDDFAEEHDIAFVHLLHADIDGPELEMLGGCEALLKEKRIGYLFLSTHSQALHLSCRRILEEHDYQVIASADFERETFSFDGLLVARPVEMPGLERLEIFSRT